MIVSEVGALREYQCLRFRSLSFQNQWTHINTMAFPYRYKPKHLSGLLSTGYANPVGSGVFSSVATMQQSTYCTYWLVASHRWPLRYALPTAATDLWLVINGHYDTLYPLQLQIGGWLPTAAMIRFTHCSYGLVASHQRQLWYALPCSYRLVFVINGRYDTLYPMQLQICG